MDSDFTTIQRGCAARYQGAPNVFRIEHNNGLIFFATCNNFLELVVIGLELFVSFLYVIGKLIAL